LTANYFQEDVISQAVAKVVSAGVVHVTAAGNSGRNSYQSPYNEYVNPVFQLNAHDFDPGESIDIYQRIRVLEGSGFVMLLQWDSPAYSISGGAGSRTDLDVYLFDQNHTNILASSAYGNIGRDPVEVLSFHNPLGSGKTKFDLMITKAYGKSPGLLKYIILNSNDGIIQEFVTGSSSIFGHAYSESAITVGAANYKETPEFGTVPPLLQSYSSAGGTPLLLELNAEVIANPILPKKPDLVAPDNVNTTFFGYDSDNDGMPNISGTSAAAPHAAGVVALLLENRPDLQPADIKNIMQRTSIDMVQRNDEENTEIGLGVDWDSGYGLIDAYAALNLSDDYQASAPIEPVDEDSGSLNVNDPNHTGGGGVLGVFSMMLLSTLLVLSNRLGAKK
jgi:subtilisin family serine protease